MVEGVTHLLVVIRMKETSLKTEPVVKALTGQHDTTLHDDENNYHYCYCHCHDHCVLRYTIALYVNAARQLDSSTIT
jgi:hypothetical protein